MMGKGNRLNAERKVQGRELEDAPHPINVQIQLWGGMKLNNPSLSHICINLTYNASWQLHTHQCSVAVLSRAKQAMQSSIFHAKRSSLPDGFLPIKAQRHWLSVTGQNGVVAAASSHLHIPTAALEPVRGSQEEGRRMWDPVLAWIRDREGETSTPKLPSFNSDKSQPSHRFPGSCRTWTSSRVKELINSAI